MLSQTAIWDNWFYGTYLGASEIRGIPRHFHTRRDDNSERQKAPLWRAGSPHNRINGLAEVVA